MEHFSVIKPRQCIACLGVTDIPVTLFELKYGQSILSEIFETCTSVKLNYQQNQIESTNFPTSICTKCLSELIAAYNFIKKCQLADVKLKSNKNVDSQPLIMVKLEENSTNGKSDSSNQDLCEEKITVNECELKEEKAVLPILPLNYVKCEDEYEKYTKLNIPPMSGDTLQKHKDTDRVIRVQCEICSVTMRFRSLKFHMMLHRGERPNMCEYCGKSFTQRITLDEHLKLHTGETPHICQYCNKAFRSKTSYKWHIQIHSSSEEPIPCGVCDKVLRSQQAWKKHQLVHNKPFLCNLCGKCYTNKTQLTEHTNVHLGLRPFRCETCGNTFSKKHELSIHGLRHQEVKPHPCDLCTRGFVTKSKLSRHKKNVHCKNLTAD